MNFKKVAKESFTQSRITKDRDKVTMEDLLCDYPDGITITDFDMIHGEDGTYPAIAFKENTKAFFFGGTVLTRICNAWLEEYSGDVDACAEDLRNSGGVFVHIFVDKNQKGKKFYNVAIDE